MNRVEELKFLNGRTIERVQFERGSATFFFTDGSKADVFGGYTPGDFGIEWTPSGATAPMESTESP